MPPHPLTNFETQKYYQNEPRFNGAYSRDNLPEKIKDGAYIINFDEYADVGTHFIAVFCNKSQIVYFDNFDVQMFLKKLRRFLVIKTKKLAFFEYNQISQQCVGTFALDSLVLYLQVKNCLI